MEFNRGENPKYRESERDEVPLKKLIPLPLVKGKGIKGIGLIKGLRRFLSCR
jgi:hypothetical protein